MRHGSQKHVDAILKAHEAARAAEEFTREKLRIKSDSMLKVEDLAKMTGVSVDQLNQQLEEHREKNPTFEAIAKKLQMSEGRGKSSAFETIARRLQISEDAIRKFVETHKPQEQQRRNNGKPKLTGPGFH